MCRLLTLHDSILASCPLQNSLYLLGTTVFQIIVVDQILLFSILLPSSKIQPSTTASGRSFIYHQRSTARPTHGLPVPRPRVPLLIPHSLITLLLIQPLQVPLWHVTEPAARAHSEEIHSGPWICSLCRTFRQVSHLKKSGLSCPTQKSWSPTLFVRQWPNVSPPCTLDLGRIFRRHYCHRRRGPSRRRLSPQCCFSSSLRMLTWPHDTTPWTSDFRRISRHRRSRFARRSSQPRPCTRRMFHWRRGNAPWIPDLLRPWWVIHRKFWPHTDSTTMSIYSTPRTPVHKNSNLWHRRMGHASTSRLKTFNQKSSG